MSIGIGTRSRAIKRDGLNGNSETDCTVYTKQVHIVGTGPAALMAGSKLVLEGFSVSFYEHKKAAARKFLVAGHGGFNLSNAQPTADFVEKYTHTEIKKCVERFDNQQLVLFFEQIGIPTYVGSTGKIFPAKGIKPIEVLNAWMNWLKSNGAVFYMEHKCIDFTETQVCFSTNQGIQWVDFDFLVMALGGGSWTKTGSDGSWVELFETKEIDVEPFVASNAGMNVSFTSDPSHVAGEVFKNVVATMGVMEKKGEITLTTYGFEGAPIYYLNRAFRDNPLDPLVIDFKPQLPLERVVEVIKSAPNPSQALKNLKLSKATRWLLKLQLTKSDFTNPMLLAAHVKAFSLKIDSLRSMEEAISTAGGVDWRELHSDFSLKKYPKIFLCGEMLNWDAPTGGYLLQAAFATGHWVGAAVAQTTK